MIAKLKDPVSGLTHLLATVLSVSCLIVLAGAALKQGSLEHLVAYSVFGVSLVLLYAASSLYHLLPNGTGEGSFLHRLDHMMIYVLIAGTYTPVCIITLGDGWGWTLLAIVWALAIFGMLFKMFTKQMAHWSSTASYVAMGWLAVLVGPWLIERLSTDGIAWFVAGGLFYTVGAVIFALEKPRLFPPWFGSHELFHLFVMAGSGSHFWATLRHVH